MKRSKSAIFLATPLLLLASIPVHAAGAVGETVDVVGQGEAGPVVSEDGASLIRAENGITVAIKMPTPTPFTYNYPPPNVFQSTVLMGAPEVFTGWVFIFNNPDLCSAPCNGDDVGVSTPARGGVYNFAGHISGGGTLRMAGHVSFGEAPFGGSPLENPLGAAIHLAVAPHGTLQADLLPTQINTPIGSPPLWWLAIFEP